jgi:hypothetical protein
MVENIADCNLWTEHIRNLRIGDLRISQKKFADLKFANLHTSEICGFANADEP